MAAPMTIHDGASKLPVRDTKYVARNGAVPPSRVTGMLRLTDSPVYRSLVGMISDMAHSAVAECGANARLITHKATTVWVKFCGSRKWNAGYVTSVTASMLMSINGLRPTTSLNNAKNGSSAQ